MDNVDVSDGNVNDNKFKEFCARQSLNYNVSSKHKAGLDQSSCLNASLFVFLLVTHFPKYIPQKIILLT